MSLLGAAPQGLIVPLSFAQERSWIMREFFPAQPPDNRSWIHELSGALDSGRLLAALESVAERHDALRSRYVITSGIPRQAFDAQLIPQFTDLSGTYQPASQEARAAAEAHTRERLDMAAGPPWRARLIRSGKERHLLALTFDSAIMDEYTFPAFWKALAGCYSGSGDPAGSGTFARYVIRERSADPGQRPAWLAGVPLPRPTELPLDRGRPAIRVAETTATDSAVDGELLRRVRDLGASWRLSIDIVGLAVASVLLGRYCRTSHVVLGACTPALTAADRAPIGVVREPAPMRIDLAGDPSLRGLTRRLATVVEDMAAAPQPSLGALIQQLGPPRDPSRPPLFQIGFLAMERRLPGFPGATARRIEMPPDSSLLDLTIMMVDHEARWDCVIVASRALYDQQTIDRLAGSFLDLLADAVRWPDRSLSQMGRPQPGPPRVLPRPLEAFRDSFRRAAHRAPHACAVSLGQQRVTYEALDRQSSYTASWLQHQGVGPEIRVAVRAHRRPELLSLILGILKAGGAFVPLTPGDTSEMIGRSAGVSLVVDPADLPPVADTAAPAVFPPVDPDNVLSCYLTSGTTGSPKMVIATHRGSLHYRDYLRDIVGLTSSDVVLQIASLTFDASIRDLLCPLAVGAHIELLDDHEAKDPCAILGRIHAARITAILAIVPSLLGAVVDAASSAAPSLRVVLVSGEQLTTTLAARVRAWAPNAKIFNQYGLTECTMTSTYHEITPTDITRGVIPIGQTIPSASGYVLADNGELQPPGALGEFYLAGPGLNRGYTSAALTAERYVPNPFGVAGSRMFRTGDLVREAGQGALVHHGRLDNQVKVRGVRVELDECESALLCCPGVKAAAVAVRTGNLVAYVVGRVSGSELRHQLSAVLPAPMVPNYYVNLPELPHSANGKVARHALPDPQLIRKRGYHPPRDALELRMRACWEDVLGRDHIGITEDFFEAGGNSLDVIMLCRQVEADFGVQLAAANVFANPTIEQLSLDEALSASCSSQRLLRLRKGKPGHVTLILLPDLTGGARRYQPLADAMGGSRVYAMEAAGRARGEEPLRDVTDMAASCLAEIRSLLPDTRTVLAGWGFGARVAVALARMIEDRGDPLRLVVLIEPEAVPPSPPAASPVARYASVSRLPWPKAAVPPGDGALAVLLRNEKEQRRLRPQADIQTMRRLVAVFSASETAAGNTHGSVRLATDLLFVGSHGTAEQSLSSSVRTTGTSCSAWYPERCSAVPSDAELAAVGHLLGPILQDIAC